LANNIIGFDVNNTGDVLMNVNIPPGRRLVLMNRSGLAMVSFTTILRGGEPTTSYTNFDMRDDGTIYFMAIDVMDRHVLFSRPPASVNPQSFPKLPLLAGSLSHEGNSYCFDTEEISREARFQ